jgi:hypothetical protein
VKTLLGMPCDYQGPAGWNRLLKSGHAHLVEAFVKVGMSDGKLSAMALVGPPNSGKSYFVSSLGQIQFPTEEI